MRSALGITLAASLASIATAACTRGDRPSEREAGGSGGRLGAGDSVERGFLTDATPADLSESSAISIELLDRGQAPFRALRYVWRIGQKEELTVDLRTTLVNDSGDAQTSEIALPPVRIAIAIDPQRVSASGDLSYAWRVTSAAVTAGTLTAPHIAEGMRAEVARVEHMSGSATVTSRGVCSAIRENPDRTEADASASSGQMEEQIRQTLRELTPPFPQEDVGRGARWQRSSRLVAKETRVTQIDTFAWVDVTTEGGRLDDALAQTAPSQPLHGPGATQARMESMLASGHAEIDFSIFRIVPQTRFSGTTTMVLSGASPLEPQRRITMALRVEIFTRGALR